MVDVGGKGVSVRRAVAEGKIHMRAETLAMIVNQEHKKGDVLAIARVAGIMAAKKTPELIPLAHPISISSVEIKLTPDHDTNTVRCEASVGCSGQTGVEMEALTAVSTALLTIYDMCKAVDRGMQLQDIQLLTKSGGKSGDWKRQD